MFDAVVLAGGAARRMAGADKPGLDVGGLSLLERVLAAVAGAEQAIVVGPPRETSRPVRWLREQPPGGGPVAALAAAVPELNAERTVVLAADLPHVAPAVPALLRALDGSAGDVACLVEPDGRVNYLAAAWRTPALRSAVAAAGDPRGTAARRLVATSELVEVPDPAGWGYDCDTWEQLAEARRRAGP